MRWCGCLMLGVATLLILRYLPFLGSIWTDRPGDEYLSDPIPACLIAFLDLRFIAPLAAVCGVSLLRGNEDSRAFMYATISWLALVGPAIAAMGYAILINGDPHASMGGTLAFAAFGVVFVGVAASLFLPLHATPRGL